MVSASTRTGLPTPTRQSIGRWLWRGAFETRRAATSQVTFVASARHYVAETRSDQLRIRYGTGAADALQIAFVGARRDIPAELHEEIPGALHLLTGFRTGVLLARICCGISVTVRGFHIAQ